MFEDIITKKQENKLFKVKSSWIKNFSYNDGTLIMKTKSGKEYAYYDVPRHVWEGLKGHGEDGGSVGTYFNEYIKGQYGYEEV